MNNLRGKQRGAAVLAMMALLVLIAVIIIVFLLRMQTHGQYQRVLDNAAISGVYLLLDTQNTNNQTNACTMAQASLEQSLPASVNVSNWACSVQTNTDSNPPLQLELSATIGDNTLQSHAAWRVCVNSANCGGQRYAVIVP